MIYLQLFQVFFVIGVFCFGGGYAILPFIQNSVIDHGWLTMAEFGDIIAVAQSTPGPVSINTATFVGYKLAGVLGALCATFALCLPAVIFVLTVVRLLYLPKGEMIMDRMLTGIRPVVGGMIFFAAWSIADTVFFATVHGEHIPLNYLSVIVAVFAGVATYKYKVSPIAVIFISALLGICFGVVLY